MSFIIIRPEFDKSKFDLIIYETHCPLSILSSIISFSRYIGAFSNPFKHSKFIISFVSGVVKQSTDSTSNPTIIDRN